MAPVSINTEHHLIDIAEKAEARLAGYPHILFTDNQFS